MTFKGEDEKKVFHVVEDSFILDELREFKRFDQTDDLKSRNLYNIEESTRFNNVEKSDLKWFNQTIKIKKLEKMFQGGKKYKDKEE